MEKALALLAGFPVSKIMRGYGNTFSVEFGEIGFDSSGEVTLSVTGTWRLSEGNRVLALSTHSDWQSIDKALNELVGKTCQKRIGSKNPCFVFKPGMYTLEVLPSSADTQKEVIWSLSRKNGFNSVGEYGNGLIIDEWGG